MCDICNRSAGLRRRDFIKTVLAGSLALSAGDFLRAEETPALTGPRLGMGQERIARLTPLGYRSEPAETKNAPVWVQIDLGRNVPLDSIKLFPMLAVSPDPQGFPRRFRLEVSDDPRFGAYRTIADHFAADFPPPGDRVCVFSASGLAGRYVRLTVLRPAGKAAMLSKLEVWAGGRDIAEQCPAADSDHGALGFTALTRLPRPQGEGVVTDNPENVIPADQWKPVAYRAQAPVSGVTIGEGLFRSAMEDNIAYLLGSFSTAQLVRPFRERAGQPVPPGLPDPIKFWDTSLPGSNAGRFLMGAGNTVRWIDHPELRRRMDEVVAAIAGCRRSDGYLMAYSEDTIFDSERGAYTRSWLTQGLIEAGFAGNPQAFPLLRGFYDWFNACPYLSELLRRGGQGVQGQTPNTRLYFTPVGKPEDIQVIQRYFQENYWMDALARRDPEAIWRYPYDHPHNYLITALEPYLDQYRATGREKYLQAAQGGWELYFKHWIHVGGSVAICEFDEYPPDSFFLHRHTGELCGSAFWIRYSQRFHLLSPDEEKYPAEIERAIYNVILANQAGSKGIRYHAALCGHKEVPTAKNTCCEGQGTRLIGSLPEYIYSLAPDGIYVNLFAPASVATALGGSAFKLAMATRFPFAPEVALTVSAERPTPAKVRVRVPRWAKADMPIQVNGRAAGVGRPGSYAVLDRVWSDGDVITFELPIGFNLTPYRGAEEAGEGTRYALEYGPILMAAVGGDDEREININVRPEDLPDLLKPKADRHLSFTIEGEPRHEYRPYWQVADEAFTCYPVVRLRHPWS